MSYPREAPIFSNRYDAGCKLAEKLSEFKGQPVVVLAIPNWWATDCPPGGLGAQCRAGR